MDCGLPYEKARDLMLSYCGKTDAERIPLSESHGRILGEDLVAAADIPPFDRSPYDGYTLIASDIAAASKDHPVTLSVLEEIPAGGVPSKRVTTGFASKVLTGAPIPEGADTVIKYETTDFTDEAVTIYAPSAPGKDIVPAGEDVRAGSLLACEGDLIDPALAGTMAAQGFSSALVFKKPRTGIISTGSELTEGGNPLTPGKIYNSNRYSLEGACIAAGAAPVYLGSIGDNVEDIAELIAKGVSSCDVVFITGGVSVGDYDLTPAALEKAGVEILVRDVQLKPGGACAYGIKGGKPVFCLSGNPASSMTNFYAVALPCLRKICGHRRALLNTTKVTLSDGFPKKSPQTRLIRGKLELSGGVAYMKITGAQGNGVLHSLIGCDVMAIVPQGSPPLVAGAVLDAYLLE